VDVAKQGPKLDKFCEVLDNPQEQGVIVAPLNVEVWESNSMSRKEIYLLSPTRVSQFYMPMQ
jgi:hypothetical protein